MDLGLQNKIIIVTGGARGIGLAIVKALVDEGAFPLIVSRTEANNQEALALISNCGDIFTANLVNPLECKTIVKQILSKYPRIDGLVNNAGENDQIGLETGNYDDFMHSLHENLVHYYLMSQYCLPALKESCGPIVNISSKVAETGQGGTSAYAAANGGRNALTREWAVELLKYDMRVNAVIVAESFTPLYERLLNTLANPEKELNSIMQKIPLGKRMTQTNEIADMVIFLLSKRANHITGQLFHVDGGYVHLDRAIT